MSYIGRQPQIGNFQICDAISTVNNQAAYTMQVGSVNVIPETAQNMIVSLNGVIQKPNSSYTVAGAVITFSSALVTGDVINFIQILGSVLDLGTPSDSTVTNAKTNFVSTSSAAGLQIKGDGTTDGTIQLNCSQNTHGIKIKSPPHSASASYTLTMPNNDGDANQFLQTNGSGVLSFASATPADNSITLAKMASGTDGNLITYDTSGNPAAVATGNSGQVLTSAGAGAVPSFQAAAGGRYTLVSTATINGGATYIDMDNVFSATYKNYLLVYTSVNPATDGADLQIQVKTASGVLSGGSDYVYGSAEIASNNNIASEYDTGQDYYKINASSGIGNQAAESASGTVIFYDPRSTTFYHNMQGMSAALSTGIDAISAWSVGTAKTTTALTGLRFKAGSGNLDSGILKLYGAND